MKKAFLLLVAILICTEISLRMIDRVPLLISFVQHDSLLGHKGPAGRTVVLHNTKLRFDMEGFRELGKHEDSDGKPVVVWLGDSAVEGISVPDEAHFITRFDSRMRTASRMYAVGDWGTAQNLLAFREFGAAKKPGLVFLIFSSITDFVNNEKSFANRYQSVVDDLRPYAEWKTDTGLQFTRTRPVYYFLRRYSYLFVTADNMRISRLLSRPKDFTGECEANSNVVPLLGYFDRPDPRWDASVKITAELLRALDREAKQVGAKLIPVYLPNDIEILDTKWNEIVVPVAKKCFPQWKLDRQGIERRFESAVALAGLKHFSLRAQMNKALKEGRDLFLYDGHFNEQGHAFVAEVFANYASKVIE